MRARGAPPARPGRGPPFNEERTTRPTLIHRRSSKNCVPPWLIIRSAQWLKIRSAPTAQPDEIASRLLAPLTLSLVCAEVLDAPEIRHDTLRLLQAVLDRTLENDDLRRSPYNDGRMGGFHLPEVVKSLLFVVVERAPGAARFANGIWDDLGQVMPLVDRMVRVAGWHPYVARQFVTLCERSGAAYPAETFADQVLAQIVDGRLPTIWKGSAVTAAIAALVQAHADRQHPLPAALARKLLRVLDALVDLGDRRSAALQQSESFRGVRFAAPV